MFLNCEGNELASGFNLPFKFENQIVKKELFCVSKQKPRSLGHWLKRGVHARKLPDNFQKF